MKLRDFVVNSLPRVRGKKKTSRGNPPAPLEVTTSGKGRHEPPPRPPVRMSSLSRESSVERASHVAVADVNWRHSPPRLGHDGQVGLVGAASSWDGHYYAPSPGMVISHSAEGISTHSMAVMASSHGGSQSLEYSQPYSHVSSSMSESAVNYSSMPRGFVIQSQHHHHRHSHQHDYHYVYHHHHHHQQPSESATATRAPLLESNRLPHHHQHHHHNINQCKANPVSSHPKSEPGFLKKSFASFKAMRKQRSNAKDSLAVKAVKTGDENGKCSVCPYPQLHVMPDDEKKLVDTRPIKPKRKGLKSLRKSKPHPDDQMDKSWYSDNDASKTAVHHLSDADLFYPATPQRPRFRECSVESCMSRLYGSQDVSCGPENDFRSLDSHSLSGYESDLPLSKAGRTRSRIKTNPWIPSPQPSLNIGRRFEHSDFRESREDVMTVDDDYPSMPRSASFEHQRPPVLSSFQTTSSKGRPVQRHRSLTPSDLKMTLSLSKKPTIAQPQPTTDPSKLSTHSRSEKPPMNDLSLPVPKSRPSSILSPSSEFVILADNIEQLANNISFEYEDMLDSTLESVSACQEDGKTSIHELLGDEDLSVKRKNNDSLFSNSSQINDDAHSPDSGIACLGSSDGDDLTATTVTPSTTSPSQSSAYCVTPLAGCLAYNSNEGREKPNDLAESTGRSSDSNTSPINWTYPCNVYTDHQNISNELAMYDSLRNEHKHSKNTYEEVPLHAFSNLIYSQVGSGHIIQPACQRVEHSNLKSSSLKDFHRNAHGSSFPEHKHQSKSSEQLPPNITRSELTRAPIESPTENWQCDIELLSNSQIRLQDKSREDFFNEYANNEIINVKSNEHFFRGLPLSFSSDNPDSKASEAAVQRSGDIAETSSLDLADACVQTDFNDDDFNSSWNITSSNALTDLCEEEFDPIESTRRWLLTGNMQGSADTGYSSQPRDSQILMDDDDSVTGFENNSDGNSRLMKKCNPSLTAQEGQTELEKADVEEEQMLYSEDRPPLKHPRGQKTRHSKEMVKTMFSGIESQFNDIFQQLWPPENDRVKSKNKRDSSGSSTSTLISETLGYASNSSPTFYEQHELNELTPRNSFCDNGDINIDAEFKQSQCYFDEKLSKKKKTSANINNEEPDYVNVPRKVRSTKHNSGLVCSASAQNDKENPTSYKKCSVRRHPNSAQRESKSSKTSFPNEKESNVSTERADYLEFLRDAPLTGTHMKRPMFLIPGFGPIEMSPSFVNCLIKPVERTKSQATADRSLVKVSEPAASVQRVQSLISKGRSGTRSKWPHKKESINESNTSGGHLPHKSCDVNRTPSTTASNAMPEKPKRKNPRGHQGKACPSRIQSSEKADQHQQGSGSFRTGNPMSKSGSYHPSSSDPDHATRSLAERVWQLQREKDLIYLQLKEVQQEELSRQRQQLQHHRNVHSQRKDTLLETLRELKTNLEEQSRKLNLACNKDVYI